MGFPYRQKGYAGSVAVSDMFSVFRKTLQTNDLQKMRAAKGEHAFLVNDCLSEGCAKQGRG